MSRNVKLIFLVFTVCMHLFASSPGRYESNDAGDPNPADVPLGETRTCFYILGTYCGGTNTSTGECAKHAVLHWLTPRSMGTIGYVKEYFMSFWDNLVAGNFPLPEEFCGRHESCVFYENLMKCKSDLQDFTAMLITEEMCPGKNQFELNQRSRQSILLLAFYQKNLNSYLLGHFGRDYLKIISENVQVRHGSMMSPEHFCRFKFPLQT